VLSRIELTQFRINRHR